MTMDEYKVATPRFPPLTSTPPAFPGTHPSPRSLCHRESVSPLDRPRTGTGLLRGDRFDRIPPPRAGHDSHSQIRALLSRAAPDVGSTRSISDEEHEFEGEDRDELTTKGRKRKRLAKACSACHVGYYFLVNSLVSLTVFPPCRRTSADAMGSHPVPTVNSRQDHVFTSMRRASRSRPHARGIRRAPPPTHGVRRTMREGRRCGPLRTRWVGRNGLEVSISWMRGRARPGRIMIRLTLSSMISRSDRSSSIVSRLTHHMPDPPS